MEKQIVQIAARIKELRLIVGLSPEELAALTEVSTEEYLRIEAGETDFSFGFVHLCAKALHVDITNLISGDDANLSTVSVVRAGEGTLLDRPAEGATYRQLASKIKNRLAEPLYVCAKYDATAQGKPIPLNSHAGEEFDYIISGALKVQVGNHINVLYPGDTIYYNSSEPHGMIAVGGTDCHFIATVIDAGGNAKKYATSGHSHPVVDVSTSVEKDYNAFIRATETADGHLLRMEYRNTDRFNFAYDVVDKLAQANPEKLALLHIDRDKTERRFTFDDIRRLSCKAANYFASLGIKKGDRVMLVLKRHWQFWVIMNAMHRLGAVVILAPNQLLKKDFTYRFERAGITAIVSTPDDGVPQQVEMAKEECPNLRTLISVNQTIDGWHFFDAEYETCSEEFPRTDNTPCGTDPLLMFFTSGTTGYPKIAVHDHTYPLGHFVTAHYWHRVQEDGLHLTISDTGWAKSLWGKLYGQWLNNAAVFVYNFDRFDAHDILPLFAKHQITTFCAPPTMYRFFIKKGHIWRDLP